MSKSKTVNKQKLRVCTLCQQEFPETNEFFSTQSNGQKKWLNKYCRLAINK